MIVSNRCQTCGERFSASSKPVGIYTECEHLHHLTAECKSSYCIQCNKIRGDLIEPNNYDNLTQKNLNYMSVVRKPINFTWTDRFRGLNRIIKTVPILIRLYSRLLFGLIDIDYLFFLNNYLVKLLDIQINCSQESKTKLFDKSYKRVIISNHTNFHDLLVIGSLLSPKSVFGFVASNIINTMSFGRAITKLIPNIIIKEKSESESESESNYKVITKYFDKYPEESKLMIFPEGMLTHHKTICKFRSTAFKLGYPIQPIIIKYKQNIFDLVNFDLWCFPKINVDVTVLDSIETDGSEDSIEFVRKKMAGIGDFYLSNVINK